MSKKLVSGDAFYYGGHILYSYDPNFLYGTFIVSNDKIIYQKSGFLRIKWSMEIPFDRVLWDKVTFENGEDIEYKQRMSGLAFLGGYGPVSTYSRNTTFVTIPFLDEKNLEQRPKFSFKKPKMLEDVSKLLYDRIPPKKL